MEIQLQLKAPDVNQPVVYSTVTKTPPPPPPPPVTTVFVGETDERERVNSTLSALLLKAQLKEAVGKIEKAQPIERRSVSPPLPPPPTEAEVIQGTLPTASEVASVVLRDQPPIESSGNKSPIMEDTVVRRMKNSLQQKSQAANDRRSYVEKPLTPLKTKSLEASGEKEREAVVTAAAVEGTTTKPCGRNAKPQSIANDLVDGKHPICCVCDIKITRYALYLSGGVLIFRCGYNR